MTPLHLKTAEEEVAVLLFDTSHNHLLKKDKDKILKSSLNSLLWISVWYPMIDGFVNLNLIKYHNFIAII